MTEAGPPGLVVGEYVPEESGEAIALERSCRQGTSLRLSFRRSAFHARAESFPEHRIVTARLEGRLVGVGAAAVKDAELFGKPIKAAFYFDLRVHPAFRGRGISRRVGAELYRWGLARASLLYTYTMADNALGARALAPYGTTECGRYAYLVYPAFRRRPPGPGVAAAAGPEVHAAMMERSGRFDFYTPPGCWSRGCGYAGSWLVRRGADIAGCSAWSHREVLGEVVEAVPPLVRLAGLLARAWPARLAAWPHVPVEGEELRSWYLFDAFATRDDLARDLLRHVAGAALERGIDYCYVVHGRDDHWVRAVRADVPRLFAPVVPYRLLAVSRDGQLPRFSRFYVDVRDL